MFELLAPPQLSFEVPRGLETAKHLASESPRDEEE
jgi:hypothetical protein